jgi:hypothetical protein
MPVFRRLVVAVAVCQFGVAAAQQTTGAHRLHSCLADVRRERVQYFVSDWKRPECAAGAASATVAFELATGWRAEGLSVVFASSEGSSLPVVAHDGSSAIVQVPCEKSSSAVGDVRLHGRLTTSSLRSSDYEACLEKINVR